MARKTEVLCHNKFHSVSEEEIKKELDRKWKELQVQEENRRQVQDVWK